MPNILIVEKNSEIRALVAKRFTTDIDHATHAGIDALAAKVREVTYDLVIWELRTSKPSRSKDIKLLERLRKTSPRGAAIVISGHEAARTAGRISAPDENCYYFDRPIDPDKISAAIAAALKSRSGNPSVRALPEIQIPTYFEGMLVGSLVMREVIEGIIDAAAADLAILITGETGTGKDLVAAAIHKRSRRKDFPYVPVNTGAMSPELIASELFGHEKRSYTGALGMRRGFFEQADRGTIFLDEISTMDEKAQMSLLRVLETKAFRRVGGTRDVGVDVRVITATNEDIREAVEQKKFREDLYYRLDVMQIRLPPLRQRPGAVTLLTDHFVFRFTDLYQKSIRVVAPETYRHLRRYSWPGNVRELKNVIQRAVLLSRGRELTPDLLPERIREAVEPDAGPGVFSIRPGMTLEAAERELIKMTLASTGGNKKTTAQVLGISRRALYNKLNRLGVIRAHKEPAPS
jgi:DNA-binding NtrC family response regulator